MAVVRHKEAIHSGHFMVSNFEAEAQDDEEDIAVPVRITKFIVVNMTSWHHGGGHGGDGDGDEAIFYFLLLQRFLRRKPHRRPQTSSRRMSKIVSSNPPYFLPYHYCLPVLEGFFVSTVLKIFVLSSWPHTTLPKHYCTCVDKANYQQSLRWNKHF